MKKIIYVTGALAMVMASSSCSTPSSKAKEVCECMEEAKKNPLDISKSKECLELQMKYQKESFSDPKQEFLLTLSECMGKTFEDLEEKKEESKSENVASSLKDKQTAAYFETLNTVIDEYITMVEEIAKLGKKVENSGEEPDLSDAMDMLSSMGSSVVKMTPMIEKMEKMEAKSEQLKEGMTPEEIKAFTKMYGNIMVRFYEAIELNENN